jgi:hypothetical protein
MSKTTWRLEVELMYLVDPEYPDMGWDLGYDDPLYHTLKFSDETEARTAFECAITCTQEEQGPYSEPGPLRLSFPKDYKIQPAGDVWQTEHVALLNVIEFVQVTRIYPGEDS